MLLARLCPAGFRVAVAPQSVRTGDGMMKSTEQCRRSSMCSTCTLATLIVVLAASSLLFAQTSTTGAVAGIVTDPSNAVVKGASVVLKETSTGQVQTTVTDAGGRYLFPVLNPGQYTVKVEAKGFRGVLTNLVEVEVNKSSNVDVSLSVGTSAEVVEVVASTMTELQTQDASVGEVLSGTELNRLPVSGRSAAQLIFYQPGVAPDMGAQNGLAAD